MILFDNIAVVRIKCYLRSVKLLYYIAAAIVVCGLVNLTVYACLYNAPPQTRIGETSAEAVVLASVLQASYTDQNKLDDRPWRGVVQVKRVLRGKTETRRFPIGRSGSSATCDDGIRPPAISAIWVLYLGKRNGNQVVLLSYPLSIARSADPSLIPKRSGR